MKPSRSNTNKSRIRPRVKSKGLRLNWTSLEDIKEVRLSDVLGDGAVVEIKSTNKPLLVP